MRFENLNLGDGSRTAEEEGKTLKSTYMKKKKMVVHLEHR